MGLMSGVEKKGVKTAGACKGDKWVEGSDYGSDVQRMYRIRGNLL